MVEANEAGVQRSLDDLSWVLAPDPGGGYEEALLGTGAERGARLRGVQDGQPRLGLFHAPDLPRSIRRILLLLPKSRARMLDGLAELGAPGTLIPEPTQPLADDPGLLLWCVDCSGAASPGLVDALIGRMFSRFLITGRPLRHYNCTFMLPLDLRIAGELEVPADDLPWLQIVESDTVERYRLRPPASLLPELDQKIAVPAADLAHAQAYEFFDTHLREQLFDRQPGADEAKGDEASCVDPIQHYRLRQAMLDPLRLELVDTQETAERTEVQGAVTAARVDDVSLYRYYNGLVLLAIRVGMPDPMSDTQLGSGGDDWWHPLVYSDHAVWTMIAERQCERWLRYTKIARLLYASFWEQTVERKIAPLRLWDQAKDAMVCDRPIRAEFSPIVIHFLRLFLPRLPASELTRAGRLRQVADDRIFVQVAYVLTGPAPNTGTPEMAQFERLFSYALYVDEKSDGWAAADDWAYDQAYTRKLMGKDCLRRWQAIGSLSGYTRASSVFMGFGPFYANTVARVHVPYVYARIQILALLFRTTLDLFDRRIGAATRRLTEGKRGERPFRVLRADFIRFTNVYWYRHLTPQVQGEEIAERVMRKQDLEGAYILLKDEMERADEYAATELNHWYQDKAAVAGWAALIIGVLALAIPFAELLVSDDAAEKVWVTGTTAAAVFTVAVVVGGFGWALRKLGSRGNRR